MQEGVKVAPEPAAVAVSVPGAAEANTTTGLEEGDGDFEDKLEQSLRRVYSNKDLKKIAGRPRAPPPEFPDLPETVDNIGHVWLTHALRSVGILPLGVEVLTLMNKDILFSGQNSTVCIYVAEYTDESNEYPREFCAKIMPAEGVVPGWLLKKFWKTEIEFYTKLSHPEGVLFPQCYFAAFGESWRLALSSVKRTVRKLSSD